jgi:hypothetical protein
MEESEYDLDSSVKGLGKLVPVLKDAHGNVIDGFHRQKIDPSWPVVTVEAIDDPTKLALARLATNFCRRKVPVEEIRESLVFLIGKCGLKPEDVAKATGISVSTVYRHLPSELKDIEKAKAGVVSGSVRTCEQTVKTQDKAEVARLTVQTPQFVECERCHVNTSTPQDWRGHNLCSKCHERAELNPEAYEGFFHYAKKQVTTKSPVEVHEYKPQETGEHRKAVMTPGVSKMDEAVFLALQQNETLRSAGWKFEFQKRYCIKRVRSDVTASRGDVEKPLFFDGEVHIGREDRDGANRGLLARRLKIPEVHAFTYEGAYSDAKRDEIVAKILETLK